VVSDVLKARERILPNDWCWYWKFYMLGHNSRDSLVCPLET